MVSRAFFRIFGKGVLLTLLILCLLLNSGTLFIPQSHASTAGVTMQNGTATIINGANTGTATLGTAVDSSKSFITVSVKSSTDSTSWTPTCAQVIGDFTSYGSSQTGITFTRQGTSCTNTVTIEYYVATFVSGVTVQRGITTTTNATSTNISLTSAVDTTISFPIIMLLTDGSSYDGNDWVIPTFTSLTGNNSSTLNVKTFSSSGTLSKVAWQVITYTNSSVQSGTATISSGSTSTTATISTVNTAKSWLLYYTNFNAGGTFNANNETTQGQISSSTQLSFSKGSSTTTVPIQYFVISFTDNSTVQSGTVSLATGATSGTDTISSVDRTASLITAGGLYSRGGKSGNSTNSDAYNAQGTLDINSSTQVTITRGITESATTDITYFVIQFLGTAINPSSNNYQVLNYGFGGGGTATSSSTNYSLFGTAGEVDNALMTSTNFKSGNGLIYTMLANVPSAPTFTNPSSYPNKLLITINQPTTNTADYQYAVAISNDNFVNNIRYIQSDNTPGANISIKAFRNYSGWGGGSGTLITNLSPGFTYTVKVKSRQGFYTESAWGSTAQAATVNPTMSFSVTPNSINLGTLTPGNITTSSTITTTVSTNGSGGATVYLYDTNAGLSSSGTGYTISAVSSNLGSVSEGYGAQGQTVSQSSGGPMEILSPYNGSANNVGIINNTKNTIFDSSGQSVTSGQGTFIIQAKPGTTAKAATDYTDAITLISSAGF